MTTVLMPAYFVGAATRARPYKIGYAGLSIHVANHSGISILMATLESITDTLSIIKPELVKKYHISSLALFGSITRDDFTDKSDIDILVGLSQPVGIEFIELADYLEVTLGTKVDLVSKKGLKQRYFDEIKNDLVYI